MSADNPLNLAQRAIGARAYQRHEPAHKIDLRLDANESPVAPAGIAQSITADDISRYPDAAAFTRTWAKFLNVDPARTFIAAGADDALSRIVQALLEPGREAIITTPSFEMIPRYIAQAGAKSTALAWEFGPFPLDAALRARTGSTRVIFLVSPNNPTGQCATRDDLQSLSRSAPNATIVLDAAYAEFADDDLFDLALTLPNVIITRTLSKAWGLAGLRIGCVIAPESLIRALASVGQPYAVSATSLAIASRWLAIGEDDVIRSIHRVRTERRQLAALLRSFTIDALDSQANFVFARTPRAAEIADTLARQGIAIRTWSIGPLAGALRITCPASEPDFARLCQALTSACRAQ
jgi:histidinol-phosphate aminotransferase